MAPPPPSAGAARPVHDKRLLCIGCLDSKHCWVCEGTGHASPHSGTGVCPKCDGAGLCTYCPAVPTQRTATS